MVPPRQTSLGHLPGMYRKACSERKGWLMRQMPPIADGDPSDGKEHTMPWTRTKPWAAVGLLVVAAAVTVVTAGTAGARGDGRWPAGFPASVWTTATWQEAPAVERRSDVLGLTDGLRLAAVFNPAQVNLNPVAPDALRHTSDGWTT